MNKLASSWQSLHQPGAITCEQGACPGLDFTPPSSTHQQQKAHEATLDVHSSSNAHEETEEELGELGEEDEVSQVS